MKNKSNLCHLSLFLISEPNLRQLLRRAHCRDNFPSPIKSTNVPPHTPRPTILPEHHLDSKDRTTLLLLSFTQKL